MNSVIGYMTMVTLLAATAFLSGTAYAQSIHPNDTVIPPLLHYQARVRSSDGRPLDGDVDVRIYIYDSATEGMSGDLDDDHLLYAESHADIELLRGWLRFTIGEGVALGPFSGADLPKRALAESAALYLELAIEGETIAPRQRMDYISQALSAEYASQANDLIGGFTLTTGNFPDDYSADNLASGTIDPLRLPTIVSAKLDGSGGATFSQANIPDNIPFSKLDTSGSAIPHARFPDVSPAMIQEETFPVNVVPASVIEPDAIQVKGGVAQHGNIAISGGIPDGCHCMPTLHSTANGGASGLNSVDLSMDPSTSAISCMMTFDAGDGIEEKVTNVPYCNYMPATKTECGAFDHNAFCDDAALCGLLKDPVNHFPCTALQIAQCKATSFPAACEGCFFLGNEDYCNASVLCLCVPDPA